jgi:hypothetical protein
VGLGAILVLGRDGDAGCWSAKDVDAQEAWLTRPLPCVEVVGRTMIERIIRNLCRIDLDVVTLLASTALPEEVLNLTDEFANLKIEMFCDLSSAITDRVSEYLRQGVENSFVISANCYAETDLLDFFYFHREGKKKITRACDHDGPLNMWVVDCKKMAGRSVENLLQTEECGSAYFAAGYIRRLEHARDLRKITADSLQGQCAMRPCGVEIRPGVWVDEGADVDRRARIVAPAYIGRGVTLREDTLVTRCSSVERECYIDYGTVVEDSSILAYTRVGIWLDVIQAVASGNMMQSLKHNVVLEIPDPGVMRWNGAVPETSKDFERSPFAEHDFAVTHDKAPMRVPDLKKESPATSEAWQLGANPIQG